MKYVRHMANHCDLNEVQKVYEKAVEAIPYSVDLWVSYCGFGVLAYEDPDDVRRLDIITDFLFPLIRNDMLILDLDIADDKGITEY